VTDHRFKYALQNKFVEEYLAGVDYVLRQLSNRAANKEPNSVEQLELYRAMNTIRGQLGRRQAELRQEYSQRGF
jgi:hypothetical protein